ncbi:MAG: RNA polymerase sigma factor [Actinopolymorphaceae bacterium]
MTADAPSPPMDTPPTGTASIGIPPVGTPLETPPSAVAHVEVAPVEMGPVQSVPVEPVLVEPVQAATDARRERWAGLLTAAQEGEREALGHLVAELTPLLWQVARSQRLDVATSEDVVQTTWLELVRHLGEIRTPEALVGWLVTVTRREARRVRDRSRREHPSDDAMISAQPDTEPRPDDQVIRNERDRILWSAFGRLSERCQSLIRVVAFADRPDYDAVSAALGMPRGSIGPTRGRCLAKLRSLLVADPSWSER